MGNHPSQPHEVEGAEMKGDSWRRITETDRPKDGEVCFFADIDGQWVGCFKGDFGFRLDPWYHNGKWEGYRSARHSARKPTHWHPFPGRVVE